MLRVLFMTVLVLTSASGYAAATETTRINFELADNPSAFPGTEATELYAGQGVRFPSRPTISRIGLWPSQVLKQGESFGGPDPLPSTVRCAPLDIEIAADLRARRVELTVLNRHLRYYSIEAFGDGLTVDSIAFWPRGGFSSPLELERTIILEAAPGEPDITRVYATIDCFDLMVIDDLVIVGDGPARDPELAYVTAYEINQGLMSRLTLHPRPDEASTPDTRLAALPGSALPVVRGRTTVARFFLGSPHREVLAFEPRLEVKIIADDGSSRTVDLRENTVPFAGPVPRPLTVGVVDPSLPEDDLVRTLVVQRNSIDSTADFVIPGAALENARLIDLKLFAPSGRQLAWVRTTLEGPFSMAFNMVRVQGTGAGSGIGGPVPMEPTRTRLRRYFNGIFPVSNLPTLSALPVFAWGGPGASRNNCYTLLSNLSGAFASAPSLPSANYQGIIFVAAAPPGCGGLGWYNTPGALTNNSSDTGAHEVGHNIGLNHVSSLHGEGAGGAGDWEPWPYVHGAIGTPNQANRNQRFGVYGAIMEQGDPGSGPWGSWRLRIVAPCATRDPAHLFPACTEPDGSIVHDYMSYGPRTTLPVHGMVNWISDINYHRVYRFLEDCTSLDPPNRFFAGSTDSARGRMGCTPARTDGIAGMTLAKLGSMPSIEALVINGVLVKDAVESLTVLRRPVAADVLSPSLGEFELVLFGKDRQERRRIRFEAVPVSHKDQEGQPARLFRVVVPFEPDLGSFTVEWQGRTLLRRDATTPPILSAGPLTTQAGWVIGQNATITWDAKDNDRQSLSALLLYSPDGLTWYPLALTVGHQGKLVVDTSELPPSDRARLYLSLSDGVNTVAAQSKMFIVKIGR